MEHLTKAFLELLVEKDLLEISICELVDRAGVSRASFYRNYKNKEEILKAYLHNLFEEWTKKWEKEPEIPLSEKIRVLIAHFEAHRDFYALLQKRDLIYFLKEEIVTLCGLRREDEKIKVYASAFVAYALYGWIDIWFQRGMIESSQEMADLFKSQGL